MGQSVEGNRRTGSKGRRVRVDKDSQNGYHQRNEADRNFRAPLPSVGYHFVVDLDLEKDFDTVNHSKLTHILSEMIKDGRVISLIRYLNADVTVGGLFEESPKRVPYGGPLNP